MLHDPFDTDVAALSRIDLDLYTAASPDAIQPPPRKAQELTEHNNDCDFEPVTVGAHAESTRPAEPAPPVDAIAENDFLSGDASALQQVAEFHREQERPDEHSTQPSFMRRPFRYQKRSARSMMRTDPFPASYDRNLQGAQAAHFLHGYPADLGYAYAGSPYGIDTYVDLYAPYPSQVGERYCGASGSLPFGGGLSPPMDSSGIPLPPSKKVKQHQTQESPKSSFPSPDSVCASPQLSSASNTSGKNSVKASGKASLKTDGKANSKASGKANGRTSGKANARAKAAGDAGGKANNSKAADNVSGKNGKASATNGASDVGDGKAADKAFGKPAKSTKSASKNGARSNPESSPMSGPVRGLNSGPASESGIRKQQENASLTPLSGKRLLPYLQLTAEEEQAFDDIFSRQFDMMCRAVVGNFNATHETKVGVDMVLQLLYSARQSTPSG